MIRDHSVLCTIGMTLVSSSESVLKAIEQKFLDTGKPEGLTLFYTCGQSDRKDGIAHLAHDGLVTKVIGGHWGLCPAFMEMISENRLEAYNLPQGQMANIDEESRELAGNRIGEICLKGSFVTEQYYKQETDSITNIIHTLPGVAEAVVVGVSDPKYMEVPAAVIKPDKGADLSVTLETGPFIMSGIFRYCNGKNMEVVINKKEY